MKRLLILFPLCLMAADVDLGTINEEDAVTIEHCHPGDAALVRVDGPGNSGGVFRTTNELVTLADFLSMLHDGTNRLEVRTVCRGQTSAVSVAVLNLQRKPKPPAISRRLVGPEMMPPLPPGMVAPLPGGTNSGYATGRQRR